MIDRSLLKKDPEFVTQEVLKKDPHFPIHDLIQLDELFRLLAVEVEQLRHKKNELALQAKKGITHELRSASIEVGKQLKNLEYQLQQVEREFNELLLSCPNLVQSDVPSGGKENNQVIKNVGEKRVFTFKPKHHVQLATTLGWLDFDTAAAMTGSNFALYKNDGASLIYALTMFMLAHNKKHGYELILPPYLVNKKSLQVAGNFPKFSDQVYHVQEEDLYLSPTAEVNLTNMYRGKILDSSRLPIRMTSWTSCFRREAGGYGAHERGLIRLHQFEKVELYTVCQPQQAQEEFDRMVHCAEELLQLLSLPYRVSLLAAQDSSFPAAKTYDIEVWMPGQEQYYEVSSCSNCTDFQARRGLIRFRDAQEKPQLVYTLNGSSLALPRLMVALIEHYQQEDGSVAIPDVLKGYGVW